MTTGTSGLLPAFGCGQNTASTPLLQKPQSILRAKSRQHMVEIQYRMKKKSNTRNRTKKPSTERKKRRKMHKTVVLICNMAVIIVLGHDMPQNIHFASTNASPHTMDNTNGSSVHCNERIGVGLQSTLAHECVAPLEKLVLDEVYVVPLSNSSQDI
jgi:hypothetical protein